MSDAYTDLFGPEYSTPERSHPGPPPASGQPQRPRRKRQAGGATTHGMNACPNVRAHTCGSYRRPAGPVARSTPFALAWERIAANERSPSTGPPLALRNDGREHVWQRRSRSQSNTDKHRTSVRPCVGSSLAGMNDRDSSHAQWHCSSHRPSPSSEPAPRCDWRNAEREILFGPARPLKRPAGPMTPTLSVNELEPSPGRRRIRTFEWQKKHTGSAFNIHFARNSKSIDSERPNRRA